MGCFSTVHSWWPVTTPPKIVNTRLFSEPVCATADDATAHVITRVANEKERIRPRGVGVGRRDRHPSRSECRRLQRAPPPLHLLRPVAARSIADAARSL